MNRNSKRADGEDECPVCGVRQQRLTDKMFGETHCSNCNTALWYFWSGKTFLVLKLSNGIDFEDWIQSLLATQLGVDPNQIPDQLADLEFSELGIDSLDTLELLMEIESESIDNQ
ncbi:MAG: phosphopantetheine-binding protein [Planctomycetota bacterium]